MSMEFDRDFNGYLDATYGHGIQVTYTPSGGTSISINVILNQEYVDIDTAGLPVQGYNPVAQAKTTDIPNIAFGDTIAAPAVTNLDGTTIKAATNYKVINFEHDNLGITSLLLEVQ
jgi:hypothetical protein